MSFFILLSVSKEGDDRQFVALILRSLWLRS